MPRGIMFGIVAILTLSVTGAQAQPYELRACPALGTTDEGTISAELLDLTYQGTPLGFTGSIQGDYKLEVTGATDNLTTFTSQFNNLVLNFLGQTSHPTVPLMMLQVDPLLRVTKAELQGQTSLGPWGNSGVPSQVLIALLPAFSLPEQPVNVGDSWESHEKRTLPGFGDMQVDMTCTLEAVEGSVARIKSQMEATLPDFEGPNPLMPEQQLLFKQGDLKITQMVREYDMADSRLLRTTGELSLDLVAMFPDLPAPLGARAKFEITSGRWAPPASTPPSGTTAPPPPTS